MTFDVVMTSKAEQQLREAAHWWATYRSAEEASRWFKKFAAVLVSLSTNPDRFSIARDDHHFSIPMREVHFGIGRKKTHRAVFTIRTDRVVVYAIRHASQRDLTEDDL